MINVLDHGSVALLDHMGDDLRIVQAAQASFNRASVEFGERERGILRFLMREEHGVPFEHVVFTFRLHLPVFLARQFVKHRMSSWSEHSGRYSELEPEFYTPAEFRRQTGKPGAYTFEPVQGVASMAAGQALRDSNDRAWKQYRYLLKVGVAKEQARLVLPLNIYTTVVWTLNLRSLLTFLHLRADEHAQLEAQLFAGALEELAGSVVPETMNAWREFGRGRV